MRPPLAERLYRLLIRCYPGEFRDEYEREMLEVFRERLAGDRRGGAAAIATLWGQVLADSLVRAPREHLDVLRQDVTYALRSLRRAPAFALTALLTLALGIGANTAVYSVVHAVAMRALPYQDANRLVRLWERNDALDVPGFSVSLPNYLSWKQQARSMDLAAWRGGSVTFRGSGDPVRVQSAAVAVEFFDLMSVRASAGRLFRAGDDAPSAPRIAVITEGLWRSHLGGRSDVVGSMLTIAGNGHTVVGIIPEESVPTEAEFFLPLQIDEKRDGRDNHVAQVIGRLKPGVTIEQAQSEMDGIAQRLETVFPASNKGWGVTMSSVYDWIVPPETRLALYVLLAAVGCVLLITCSNVAGLMLARATARRREIALRMAIGAARRRLVRQVLTEGVVITAAGGAAGVLLAWWSVPLLRQWLPATLPRADEATVNAPVLLFSLVVCVVTGLAFALLPALAGSRGNLVETLKEGSRGSTGGGQGWRQALAAGQVAMATMLLIGAGLLVQSLERLQSVRLGFDPSQITTAMIGLPGARYETSDAGWAFYGRLIERLQTSPGISAAALSSGAPFGGGNTGMPIHAVGPSQMGEAPLQTDWRMVSPNYFAAMRIPVIRGSAFSGNPAADDRTLVVSATMARRMWGDEDPIGRQIKAGPNGLFRVIGVVDDVRNLDLSLDPAPTMYLPASRYLWPTMTIVVRTTRPDVQPASLIRGVVRELDPQLALHNIRPMEALVSDSASQGRLNATLSSAFAMVAALLAAIGVYGVLAYLVSQRRQEIGIRLALGAARGSIVRLFLARGLRIGVIGLAAGVLGALGASRWMASMTFGVSARDPWTIIAGGAAVALVTLAACYVPARRAAGVDPLLALRVD